MVAGNVYYSNVEILFPMLQYSKIIYSSIGELTNWDGQSPPTPIHQVGKEVITKEELGQELPSFGTYNNIKDRVYIRS